MLVKALPKLIMELNRNYNIILSGNLIKYSEKIFGQGSSFYSSFERHRARDPERVNKTTNKKPSKVLKKVDNAKKPLYSCEQTCSNTVESSTSSDQYISIYRGLNNTDHDKLTRFRSHSLCSQHHCTLQLSLVLGL